MIDKDLKSYKLEMRILLKGCFHVKRTAPDGRHVPLDGSLEREDVMEKMSPSRLCEVNRLLGELHSLLPEARFDYDEKTGVLVRVVLNIKENPLREINFFDSRPRSFPTPNFLCLPSPVHSRSSQASPDSDS